MNASCCEWDALLAASADLLPVGLLLLAPDGGLLEANREALRLLGDPLPFAPGADVLGWFARRQPDLVAQAGRERAAPAAAPRDADDAGAALPPGLVASLLQPRGDGPFLLMVRAPDAPERLAAELQRHRAWIDAIAAGIADYALLALDGTGHIQNWNTSIGRVTGFEEQAVTGRSFAMFYPEEGPGAHRVTERLAEADRNGWSLDEGWRRRADGSRFWGSCLIAPLHARADAAPADRAYSLIIRDITERRQASESLRRSVLCDHLTGVANRRAFFEAAELELERWLRLPQPLSVVLVDADHFGRIHAEHGQVAADALLRHLAAGLAATFRTRDMVARLDAGQFVALLPGASLEGAACVAARLCQCIAAQQVDVDGRAIRYTVSAGVAAMDSDVASLDALLKRADAALQQAKARGRNCVERWSGVAGRPSGAMLPA